MARSLLDDVVRDDARLAWRGGCVALAVSDAERVPLEEASFCVVDLETTGLSPARSRICEIGAVRIEALELAATFQTLVNPRERLPLQIAALTGIDEATSGARRAPRWRRGGSSRSPATPCSSRTTRASTSRSSTPRSCGSATAGSRRPSSTPSGSRGACSPDAQTRFGLASLAQFFGTGTRPCHRALPDAEATAEILLRLIGLAQERGARTVADLVELSAPRRRRVYGKRSLAFGAPTLPGVYLFRDAHGQVLYVGRARDLRARLRSYFRSERQRPSVEAALAAVESIEWRVLGSELEAALEELRLLRELRPPANARSTRPDRYVYLARARRPRRRLAEADAVRPAEEPPPSRARRARARACTSSSGRARRCRVCGASSRRTPMRCGTRTLRGCATAIAAVEGVAAELERLERLRATRALPARPGRGAGLPPRVLRRVGTRRGDADGRRPAAALELEAGLAEARRAEPSLAPEDADELLVDRAVPAPAAARAPRRDLRRPDAPPRCVS